MKSLVIITFVMFIGYQIITTAQTVKYDGPLMANRVNLSQMRNKLAIQSINIPVIIHLDKTIAKKIIRNYNLRTKLKALTLFKKILNTVEKLFLLPHLHQDINFNIIDVKILKNSSKNLMYDENVSKYLKSYCVWQSEKKILKGKKYYSILFTGLDLYYLDRNRNQVRTSTGRGYMGGICSLRNSCTVLEWHKENVAYILAHEVAHSLGVSHDGPSNKKCINTGKNIMSAKYNPKNPAKSWSPCNRWELEQFLQSNKAACLRPK